MSYYPEPDSYDTNKIKVELDLYYYAARVDTSELAKKDDLSSHKSKVKKLEVINLKLLPLI